MFACSRSECGVLAVAWVAALAAARTCRGVRVDDAWPRCPRPAELDGTRAAWSAGLRSSWAGGAARAGQADQRSEPALESPDIMAVEHRRAGRRRRSPGAPLLGVPNVGCGFRQTLKVRTLGCVRSLSLLPIYALAR